MIEEAVCLDRQKGEGAEARRMGWCQWWVGRGGWTLRLCGGEKTPDNNAMGHCSMACSFITVLNLTWSVVVVAGKLTDSRHLLQSRHCAEEDAWREGV